ncbi:MAG: L,D-transpeptidase family protein [Nitrospinota bacterium]|nr:L,D-transpeptidase family protein [Nitrospinota bacterium]
MFDNLKRDIFVLRTNVRVAYTNFALKQSFRTRPVIPKKVVTGTLSLLIVVTLTFFTWSNRTLIGNSAVFVWDTAKSTAVFTLDTAKTTAVFVSNSAKSTAAYVSEKSALIYDTVKNTAQSSYETTANFVTTTDLFIGESMASIQESFESKKPVVIEKQETVAKPEPEKELEKLAIAPEPPAAPLLEKYAVAVDKKNRKLHILREFQEHFEVVNSFDVSLGKNTGRKETQGDLKTPVGLYHVTEIITKDLDKIYGPRAFVLNYPNMYDRKKGRTGGGIWLHGTGIGERTPDTRGCVELTDKNIVDLDQWVFKDTTVAIFPEDMGVPFENGRLQKHYLTETFFYEGDMPAFKPVASKTAPSTSQVN